MNIPAVWSSSLSTVVLFPRWNDYQRTVCVCACAQTVLAAGSDAVVTWRVIRATMTPSVTSLTHGASVSRDGPTKLVALLVRRWHLALVTFS